MAYSMSGSSEAASKRRLKTAGFDPIEVTHAHTVPLTELLGRSRQGLPVRAIHNTASTNSRLLPPLRPGSLGLPKQCGSIFAHWASVKTNLSIKSLNHTKPSRGILFLNRP